MFNIKQYMTKEIKVTLNLPKEDADVIAKAIKSGFDFSKFIEDTSREKIDELILALNADAESENNNEV